MIALVATVTSCMNGNKSEKAVEDETWACDTVVFDNLMEDSLLVFPTPNGDSLHIAEVVKANRITLIDCWASWCGPCRAEMPNMVELYNKYHDKGLEIVGISFDTDAAEWKKAIEDLGMTWPQCSELNGWNNVMRNIYEVTAIPHTFLIDNEGSILAEDIHGYELERLIENTLK